MLSLFREEAEVPNGEEFALKRARDILVSYLNKGIIPNWEEFFKDLPTLESSEVLEHIKRQFLELTDWPFLEMALDDDTTEYFFHAPDKCQKLKRSGEKENFRVLLSSEDWQLWLEIISLKFRQNWNVQVPFASFYGKIGEKNFRWSLVHASTSPEKISKLVLRSLAQTPHSLSSFGDTEAVERLVQKKKNFVVAGATGSGKTSLLTSLLSQTEKDEHLVILEDTYEILSPHPHLTRFLSGETKETSLRAYLAYSLRLSPDRIILGEMRSHEAVPFVMAMNTGHKGLMGSLHASSAVDAIHRIALLFTLYSGETGVAYDKVVELVCRNLEYVVFMENKKIKEIIRILGADKGTPFFDSILGDGSLFD